MPAAGMRCLYTVFEAASWQHCRGAAELERGRPRQAVCWPCKRGRGVLESAAQIGVLAGEGAPDLAGSGYCRKRCLVRYCEDLHVGVRHGPRMVWYALGTQENREGRQQAPPRDGRALAFV